MLSSVVLAQILLPLALGNVIQDHRVLYERANAAVPEATPTGPFCGGGATASATVPSASELASAIAGCNGIAPAGATRNDILDGICKPFTLLFARGTTEQGNIGSIVGPPFVVALESAFGANNVAVQGVNNYPADTAGYCAGGSRSGSKNLASLIKRTKQQCPKTTLCVSGYSQGAQVVHNAAEFLVGNSAATNFIDSVVLFGDPDRHLPVGKVPSSKVSIDCHKGDNICQNGEIIKPEHLTYCHDVGSQAAFVKAQAAN